MRSDDPVGDVSGSLLEQTAWAMHKEANAGSPFASQRWDQRTEGYREHYRAQARVALRVVAGWIDADCDRQQGLGLDVAEVLRAEITPVGAPDA